MKAFAVIAIAATALVMFISGMMAFFLPYSSRSTRIHVIFGLIFILITLIHGYHHRKKLFDYLGVRRWVKHAKPRFFALLILGLVMYLSWMNAAPVKMWMGLAYEERQQKIIFRAHPQSVYQRMAGKLDLQRPAAGIDFRLELDLNNLAQDKTAPTHMAIWIEDDQGRIIETLFLSQALAFVELIYVDGKALQRKQLLPIWWHKRQEFMERQKEMLLGNELMAVSSASVSGSFSLDSTIANGLAGFRVCLEINQVKDENKLFHSQSKNFLARTPEGLGQPSVFYSSYVDLQRQNRNPYSLMEFEGRGDCTGEDGELTQNHSGLTSALKILEKGLLKVERK